MKHALKPDGCRGPTRRATRGKREAEVPEGWQAWVVVRRSISDPTEVVSHRVCAPKQTTLQQIAEVAGERWKVEEASRR